jgi:hypothetical protein
MRSISRVCDGLFGLCEWYGKKLDSRHHDGGTDHVGGALLAFRTAWHEIVPTVP